METASNNENSALQQTSSDEMSSDSGSDHLEDQDDNQSSGLPDWCKNQCYDRYWKHRTKVEHWFHKHLQLTDPVNQQRRGYIPEYRNWPGGYVTQHSLQTQHALTQHYYNSMQYWQQRYYTLLNTSQSRDVTPSHYTHDPGMSRMYSPMTSRGDCYQPSSCSSTEPKPATNKRMRKKKYESKKQARTESPDLAMGDIIFDVDPRLLKDSHDDEVIECHMHITDEMVDFFAQSAKHRKERDEQKQREKTEKKEDVFVDFSKASKRTAKPSTAPPSVRPGQKRTAEMKLLYGKGAAMIHGMETAMQLNYDRHLDMKQPKHWPHLPINIKFAS